MVLKVIWYGCNIYIINGKLRASYTNLQINDIDCFMLKLLVGNLNIWGWNVFTNVI